MKHLRLWIIALLLLVVIQGVALASLWLLAGQSISNSVLVNETFFGGPFRFIKKMEVVLNPFFRGEKPETHMPHYVLHIEADEYQEVVNALPTETSSRWYGNILTLERENRPWVNGTFYADGEEYDVKVRIRGDLRNHWGDTKKSWRVKFPREQNFNGMREVNFIIPEDRKWFAEPLNVHRAKKFGLVQPHMQFATISLNNSEPLVYLEVEHWGKEMLEKQGIPGDINFYNVGAGSSQYNFWDDPSEIAYWDKYEQYPSTLNSVEDLDTLLQLLEEEDSESLLPKLEALFDIEMLIHW